jgi:hypothetical protein
VDLRLSSDSAMSGFGEGGGGPCLSRGHRERSFGKHRAVLACQESAVGFAVDATRHAGDDGFAVLGEYQRLPLLEPPDLFRAQDRKIVGRERAAAIAPVCQVRRVTRTRPTRSEISWLNAPSLDPPNSTKTSPRPPATRELWKSRADRRKPRTHPQHPPIKINYTAQQTRPVDPG